MAEDGQKDDHPVEPEPVPKRRPVAAKQAAPAKLPHQPQTPPPWFKPSQPPQPPLPIGGPIGAPRFVPPKPTSDRLRRHSEAPLVATSSGVIGLRLRGMSERLRCRHSRLVAALAMRAHRPPGRRVSMLRCRHSGLQATLAMRAHRSCSAKWCTFTTQIAIATEIATEIAIAADTADDDGTRRWRMRST